MNLFNKEQLKNSFVILNYIIQ